jgi:hypothetical protein
MSTYNLLRATVTCPRCGQTSAMAIETFFGYGILIEYGIGDHVSHGTPARVSNTADDRNTATLMAKVTPCALAVIWIFFSRCTSDLTL